MRKQTRRQTRKAHAARKVAMQMAGLGLGFIAALPFVVLMGTAIGDGHAGTNYTGALIRAALNLI